MKTVIKLSTPSKDNLISVLDHLFKSGKSDFIVFSTFFSDIENEISDMVFKNDGKIVFLKSYKKGTTDSLLSIRGSLTERFLVVYSDKICKFNIREVEKSHHNSTLLSTLLCCEDKTVGAFFETEIFDYMTDKNHFEREVIPRIFEDDEVQIYK